MTQVKAYEPRRHRDDRRPAASAGERGRSERSDGRASTTAQRRVAGWANDGPQARSQRETAARVSASAQTVAQRVAAEDPWRLPVQRAPLEDEELQMKTSEVPAQREMLEEEELQMKARGSVVQRATPEEEEELLQGKAVTQTSPESSSAPAPNRTGLPDAVKSGVESLSGIDLSDVRVHYNSSRPAGIGAHAFTQGSDIHVAPGHDQHLPHEAWHVVQQRQGIVTPTASVNGVPINDDGALEHEADVMGARAARWREDRR